MRYLLALLTLLVISIAVVVPAAAQVSIADKATVDAFALYPVGDKYIALALDSNDYILLEVLDSSLSPVAAYNLTVKATGSDPYGLYWDVGVGYRYVYLFNMSSNTLDAVYYNETGGEFYRFYTNVTGALPPSFDFVVLNATAPSYYAAMGMVTGAFAGDTVLPILYVLDGTQAIQVNVSGITFSAAIPVSTITAVVLDNDTVYFGFGTLHEDTPALFYGYYNVTSGSGKLYIADCSELTDYGSRMFENVHSFIAKDGEMLYIAAIDLTYYTMLFTKVNATDMSIVDSKVIRFHDTIDIQERNAGLFDGYMAIFGTHKVMLIDVDSGKVYMASIPVGSGYAFAIHETLGGIAFYDNGSVFFLRPTSVKNYAMAEYKEVIVYNATDGIETLSLSPADYSAALAAATLTGVDQGLQTITPSLVAAFSITLDDITYIPTERTVTETVTEALPVPVEETVTETVTTIVEKPVIGTEAFIAILFILLIAAAVMLYSRSR